MPKIQRTDVPITINPKDIENNVPKAVRALNEFVQQLKRKQIEIETRLNQHDEVINGD